MANKRELLVGGFVLAGIVATVAVISAIGSERRVFDAKAVYSTSFPDVQGLKSGAPVRLSGIDIGIVRSVGHGPNPADDRLYVQLEIVRSEAGRIREDSVVKVANKGLLGDKMVEITPGTPGRPSLPAGSSVRSEDPSDFTALITQMGEIASKANQSLANVEKITNSLADDATRKDLQQSLRSVTLILNSVATSQGYAGKLLNDPAEAERINHTLASFERTSQKLTSTLDSVNVVIDRINKGPGFAHSMIYDADGNKAVAQIGDAAGEAATTLKGIREGNGLAKTMIYGGPGQEKIGENLIATSADLKAIMHDMRAGKGTLGGLLVDPSIYEDMKAVLGNVQRNDVLRALVRYSIKQDEKKPAVNVDAAPSK